MIIMVIGRRRDQLGSNRASNFKIGRACDAIEADLFEITSTISH